MSSRWQKLAFSTGSLAAALSYQAFNTYAQFFYVDTMKLSAGLVGLGMVLYGFWNAVNDPILGQVSDRTRTRWGRRVPYILFGTVPLVLAFILVWTPPFGAGAAGGGGGTAAAGGGQTVLSPLFLYFVLAIFLFDGLFTLVVINWTALFPELYPTLAERAEVSTYRQVLGIVGLILGIALPPALYGAIGWGPMAIIFGVITGAAMFVSLLGTHEKKEFSLDQPLGLRAALSQTMKNKSFITFVIASMFINFAFVTLTAAVPFYAKYVLKIGGNATSIMLAAAFLVALPSVYFWSGYAVRHGARRALIWSLVTFGVATIPFVFAQNLVGGLIGTALIGAGLGGLLVLTDLLLSDVVDEDELRTGTRREGMYFGINGLFIRLAGSIQAAVTALILTGTGYQADLAEQAAGAVIGLRALMTALPVAGMVIALAAMYYYPLHGARLDQVKAEVEALHAQKAERAAAKA